MMTLQPHHLAMLLQVRSWAPPCNQHNMPALHPGTSSDLLDCGLMERNEAYQLVLTQQGEQAVAGAVEAMRSAACQVTS